MGTLESEQTMLLWGSCEAVFMLVLKRLGCPGILIAWNFSSRDPRFVIIAWTFDQKSSLARHFCILFVHPDRLIPYSIIRFVR